MDLPTLGPLTQTVSGQKMSLIGCSIEVIHNRGEEQSSDSGVPKFAIIVNFQSTHARVAEVYHGIGRALTTARHRLSFRGGVIEPDLAFNE